MRNPRNVEMVGKQKQIVNSYKIKTLLNHNQQGVTVPQERNLEMTEPFFLFNFPKEPPNCYVTCILTYNKNLPSLFYLYSDCTLKTEFLIFIEAIHNILTQGHK